MNKRMLINATDSDELRIAIVDIDTQNLLDLVLDVKDHKTQVGNVYIGEITSKAPSLNAAFVKYTNGTERHGFLPLKDISPEYFFNEDGEKNDHRASINDLKEGQKVMVQVEKEPRGNKGAALTTNIGLASSYLVVMANNPRAAGISRRVEPEDREDLREILSTLPVPEGMGCILRTAGVGKTSDELLWDLKTLLNLWEAIKKAYNERQEPCLIYQESNIVMRTIRDYLKDDVVEVLIDNTAVFEDIKTYLEQIRPDFLNRLILHNSEVPLFSHYQIERQIELAHQRQVQLPNGGVIIIDYTEALVAIDVNSARSTKGRDIDETALNTNLEAAEVIARYLRICDIGGLIVIDFIDMPPAHRALVEQRLRDALKPDKAKTQVGSISSRFGILQMSRQRLRRSLGEATRVVCPRCNGWGTIRSVESLAMSILRMIEEDAVKPNTSQIQVQLPINIATFLINEKREILLHIEKKHDVKIVIVPNPELESPIYHIKRVSDDTRSPSSYRLLKPSNAEDATNYKKSASEKTDEKPAVKTTFLTEHASSKKQPTNIVKRFFTNLFGSTTDEEEETANTVNAAPTAPTTIETKYSTSQSAPSKHQRNVNKASDHRHSEKMRPQKNNLSSKNREDKFKAPASSEDEKAGTDSKSRTRRGTRGGRRRVISPMQHSLTAHGSTKPSAPPTVKPVTTEQTALDHLPPFPTDPTDLENYYQTSVKSNKRLYRGPSNSKTEKVSPEKTVGAATANPALPEGTTDAEKPKDTRSPSNASKTNTLKSENKAVGINKDQVAEEKPPIVVRFESKNEE